MSQTSDLGRQAATEQWVINVGAQLGLPLAASEDDFFDAGATSLAMARIVARAEAEFGAEALSPDELIEQSTVGQIAATIVRNTPAGTSPASLSPASPSTENERLAAPW